MVVVIVYSVTKFVIGLKGNVIETRACLAFMIIYVLNDRVPQ